MTEAEQRAERRAQIQATRKLDASLDASVLENLASEIDKLDTTEIERLAGELLNPRMASGTGASAVIEVQNLNTVLSNLRTITAALIAEGLLTINEGQPE